MTPEELEAEVLSVEADRGSESIVAMLKIIARILLAKWEWQKRRER